MLREVAEGICEFIGDDPILHDDGNVTVIVEDKADVGFEIANAIAQLGVCVMIAIEGFDRVDRSPVPQGNLRIQISCYENPELNRTDAATLTAQGVAERIANILHYCQFEFLAGQMILNGFTRDDTDEANIVRMNFTAHAFLGIRDTPGENETPTE